MDEGESPGIDAVQLTLEGFEGPLDLLLELARRQAVDLGQISVTALVDQYLSATSDIARIDLSRAADWLVMAAWLVWLKSRLLLPKNEEEARQAEEAAQILTERLAVLERIRSASAWLERQPQLGQDIFERGRYDEIAPIQLQTGYVDLFRAALAILKSGLPQQEPELHRLSRPRFWTPHQAIARIRQLVPELPEGSSLLLFVPKLSAALPDFPLRVRAAIAGTLIASLELARDAEVTLRQDEAFEPILVHAERGRSERQEAGDRENPGT